MSREWHKEECWQRGWPKDEDPCATGHITPSQAWEDTPAWMFWKPVKRRMKVLGTCRCCPTGLYEYQHPAFVAREILENRFAPEKTDQDRA